MLRGLGKVEVVVRGIYNEDQDSCSVVQYCSREGLRICTTLTTKSVRQAVSLAGIKNASLTGPQDSAVRLHRTAKLQLWRPKSDCGHAVWSPRRQFQALVRSCMPWSLSQQPAFRPHFGLTEGSVCRFRGREKADTDLLIAAGVKSGIAQLLVQHAMKEDPVYWLHLYISCKALQCISCLLEA